MRSLLVIGYISLSFLATAQGLVDVSASPYAAMTTTGLHDVRFTGGFWKERQEVCANTMLPQLWKTYTSREMCYSFQNFRIAAGLDTGRFRGPSFHDGDFYKTLEAVAAMYAVRPLPQLAQWMDEAIDVIGKAQKADGYIYTKNIIEQRKTGKEKMFDDQLSFEAYNFGHLMTAACVHHRATGKNTLLDIAKKAADFLIGFYKAATPEQARNAICPSHYMGLTELYRATGEKKYLDLAVYLINIRGTVEGTDDNSDRAPFRNMNKVAGHAVRANYLFAGVADVYAETGDTTLLHTLHKIWDNVTGTKMYITGGCGALYDGVSVDGTAYKPDTVQKVHQSYGRDYQLPNLTAHNETCANIGNLLWNWRMFLLTGESKYMDVVELALYNSVLSGVSMDGTKYFYTNPLAASSKFPYHLRWEGGRVPYISKSNCCPPNLVRTIAEAGDYMYSFSSTSVYVNLYGANQLNSTLANGSAVRIQQQTAYPWNGDVTLTINEVPTGFAVNLRIPEWCTRYTIAVNGKTITQPVLQKGYVVVKQSWKKGDVITLKLDMPPVLIESNPLVEETRNQVAVKRGPIVYCVENTDQNNQDIFNLMLPANAVFTTVPVKIDEGNVLALVTTAKATTNTQWKNKLYQPITNNYKTVPLKLIPYYAWANRGKSDMTVWLPLIR